MKRKIEKISFIPITIEASNWSESTVIVKVTDEEGRYGIGEADGSPSCMREYSLIQDEHKWLNNPLNLMIGKDPIEFNSNWDLMYQSTKWTGMRGFGLFAISGIDMALYDLAGKQFGVPTYKLLGGKVKKKFKPYFTLYPSVDSKTDLNKIIEAYIPLIELAKKRKCKALKVCVMPNEENSDREIIEYIKELRNIIGYNIDMMVDFLYRWKDWKKAKWTLDKLSDVDLYFAEACLDHDDIIGHKKLSNSVNTRICGAEMSTTRFEAIEWLKEGQVSVIQSDYNRCGGLTELKKIEEYCGYYNVQLMPHNWKTGITGAACRQFSIANSTSEYSEYLHSDFWDGKLMNLVLNEPKIKNGFIEIEEKDGLGVELNKEMIKEITGKAFKDY